MSKPTDVVLLALKRMARYLKNQQEVLNCWLVVISSLTSRERR